MFEETALRADGAVTHGGEGALDWVRGAQMFPVLGREVVGGQQQLAILSQALDCLLVFQLLGFDEGIERGLGVCLRFCRPARLHPR